MHHLSVGLDQLDDLRLNEGELRLMKIIDVIDAVNYFFVPNRSIDTIKDLLNTYIFKVLKCLYALLKVPKHLLSIPKYTFYLLKITRRKCH